MSRIIVNNRSSLDALTALGCVREVIKLGRISGDSYCFCSTFMAGHRVTSNWSYTKTYGITDLFTVTDPPKPEAA